MREAPRTIVCASEYRSQRSDIDTTEEEGSLYLSPASRPLKLARLNTLPHSTTFVWRPVQLPSDDCSGVMFHETPRYAVPTHFSTSGEDQCNCSSNSFAEAPQQCSTSWHSNLAPFIGQKLAQLVDPSGR